MMVTLCLAVGRRGRPEIEISMEMLTALVKEGHTARRIADMMGCSTSFVYNKLYRAGLKMRDRYSCDTDVVLRGKIKSINEEFPHSVKYLIVSAHTVQCTPIQLTSYKYR